MLNPKQFIDDIPLPDFEIEVENLKIGDIDIGPCHIPVSYDTDYRPILNLGKHLSDEQAFSNVMSDKGYASIKYNGEEFKVLITKMNFSLGLQDITAEGRLAREPLVLADHDEAEKFEAILLNTPDFIIRPILLEGSDGNTIKLQPIKSGKRCLITGHFDLSANEPLTPILPFLDFITFLNGTLCGLGNLVASKKDDSQAFRLIGFTRNDNAKRQVNWFDMTIQNELPEIFMMFSRKLTEETPSSAIRQSINFYRASNASREISLEMSIIAAHSALEAIVNFILEHQAGWTQRLMSERSIRFSEKIRAAAHYYGLNREPLEKSPELKELSKDRNNMDGFDTISFMRNKLVHQDKNFKPTGVQLHETWVLTQWLVEVLIFAVIGYRGEIFDRRQYSGWREGPSQIPLER